jgi:hypothetical protein
MKNNNRSSTHDSTIQNAYTNVQVYRQQSGADFEKEIRDRLVSRGIITKKKTVLVATNPDVKKISDYFFVGGKGKNKYWIEATTCIANQNRVEELITKKEKVQAVDPTINKWVVFFRKDPRQRSQSKSTISGFEQQFTKAGYVFCNGDEEINNYIESILKAEGMLSRPTINIAKGAMIPINKIKKHPDNRYIEPQNKERLVDSITDVGYVTQLNVVPESINGVLTGNYLIIEGNTRYEALIDIVQMGNLPEDVEILCAVVHWLTSEDKEEVNELLCRLNTLIVNWKTKDYIKWHYDTSQPSSVDNPHKHSSYSVLMWLGSADARRTLVQKKGKSSFELLGETKLIYIYGPKLSNATNSKWIDTKLINKGHYRSGTEDDPFFEKRLMESHRLDVLMPFHKWYAENDHVEFDMDILSRLMKGSWERYKSGNGNNITEVNLLSEYFKNNPPLKATHIDNDFWKEAETYIKKNLPKKSKVTRTSKPISISTIRASA